MTPLTDQEPFLQLIQTNKGIIYKICNSYCRNKNDREDLAQEIIYQLWKSGKNFDTSFRFSTWMYRVALNTAISFYRKERKASGIIAFTEEQPDIEDKTDGTDEMEERINLLQQFIAQLRELDKALMLLYLEAKTYGEIADILGITETNVATRINRIKEKMKQHFSTLNI